ncbi:MAG TPA: hypothetical protein VGD69_21230 [Herpetosiphonaceae bacterium]
MSGAPAGLPAGESIVVSSSPMFGLLRMRVFHLRAILVLALLASVLGACGTDHAAIRERLVGTWRSNAARDSNRTAWGWEFFADGTVRRTLYSEGRLPTLSMSGKYTVLDTDTLRLQFEEIGTGAGTPLNSFSGSTTTTFQVISHTLTITETYQGGSGPIQYHRADE